MCLLRLKTLRTLFTFQGAPHGSRTTHGHRPPSLGTTVLLAPQSHLQRIAQLVRIIWMCVQQKFNIHLLPSRLCIPSINPRYAPHRTHCNCLCNAMLQVKHSVTLEINVLLMYKMRLRSDQGVQLNCCNALTHLHFHFI